MANGTNTVQNQEIPQPVPQSDPNQGQPAYETIFCSTCGKQIAKAALQCPFCGTPVYQNLQKQPTAQNQQPMQIVINNTNTNANINKNANMYGGMPWMKPKNKWVAFFLCLFLGIAGAHKFYEGRVGMGILYLLTGGLFAIGWFIDLIALLFKSNPYYVK